MVLRKGDYDRILQLIANIKSNQVDFRLSVLNLLSELFGYRHLTFFLSDKDGLFYNPTVKNMNQSLMKDYDAHYFKTDIFHPVNSLQRLIDSNVLSVESIMRYQDFENTEYYNDLLKKYNLYYELAIPLKIDNRLLGGIGILRSKDEGDFSDKDVLILNILNKHISANLNSYLETMSLRNEKQVIQDSTHGLPVGVVILDNTFSLIFVNETAQDYCRELADKLHILGTIPMVIKTLLSRISLQPLRTTSFLQTTFGIYSFKIMPFIVPSLTHNITTYYSVYITNSAQTSAPADSVAALYDLTERETEIVRLILEGLNNNEIGTRLYISPHTVKTHILNIFKKTQVNRRAALIKKIHEHPRVL